MAVQIGVGLFTAQVPPGSNRTFTQEYREILDMVRLAETLGFDSAWVSEHHGSGDGYMPSLLPTLAALAAATDRIRLGTGILLTPFHHPLRLAEDAATVDLISAGRPNPGRRGGQDARGLPDRGGRRSGCRKGPFVHADGPAPEHLRVGGRERLGDRRPFRSEPARDLRRLGRRGRHARKGFRPRAAGR